MGALVDGFGRHALPVSMLVFAGTTLLPAFAGSALALGAALALLGPLRVLSMWPSTPRASGPT